MTRDLFLASSGSLMKVVGVHHEPQSVSLYLNPPFFLSILAAICFCSLCRSARHF